MARRRAVTGAAAGAVAHCAADASASYWNADAVLCDHAQAPADVTAAAASGTATLVTFRYISSL
jgi:hypothetical protein